jgi:outer membrane lipoprotein SlyB
MNRSARLALASVALLAAGCATAPSGPREMSLPGTGKSFEQFRADDIDCRQYAHLQANGTPAQAQSDAGVASAAVGTVVGAAAGALIGGNSGAAAAGAGAGLIVGAAAGASAAQHSSWTAQQRYDNGYKQCMYAKGHRIPVRGRFAHRPVATASSAPPPAAPSGVPPDYSAPPAGIQPPPPPPGTR